MSDLPSKVRKRIEVTGEHWLWTGAITGGGYGQYAGQKTSNWLAHRLVWVLLGGELPDDLHHECGVTACVSPRHLTPLTKSEHSLEHAKARERTACKNGHPYTEASTYWRKNSNGRLSRQCKICGAERAVGQWGRMGRAKREATMRAAAQKRRERNGWKKQAGSRY